MRQRGGEVGWAGGVGEAAGDCRGRGKVRCSSKSGRDKQQGG